MILYCLINFSEINELRHDLPGEVSQSVCQISDGGGRDKHGEREDGVDDCDLTSKKRWVFFVKSMLNKRLGH